MVNNDQIPACTRITKLQQKQENTAKNELIYNICNSLQDLLKYKRALHRLSVEEQLFPLESGLWYTHLRIAAGMGGGGEGYNKNNYVRNYTHLYSLS